MSELGSILTKIGAIDYFRKSRLFFNFRDTNSCLSAIVAKKHKVPVFHIEAGNRCFDDRVPEEINRRLVDTISDINLVYSPNAKQNLLHEGYPNDKIFIVGRSMKEVLQKNKKKIDSSSVLRDLCLEKDGYVVLSTHRSESVDNQNILATIIDAVTSISEKYKCPIIFPCHPRTKDKIEKFS